LNYFNTKINQTTVPTCLEDYQPTRRMQSIEGGEARTSIRTYETYRHTHTHTHTRAPIQLHP